MPLTESYVDTFPMGMDVDFSSQFAIPIGIINLSEHYNKCKLAFTVYREFSGWVLIFAEFVTSLKSPKKTQRKINAT